MLSRSIFLAIFFIFNFLILSQAQAKSTKQVNTKKELVFIAGDIISFESLVYTNYWQSKKLLFFLEDILSIKENKPDNIALLNKLLCDLNQPISFILANSNLEDIAVALASVYNIESTSSKFLIKKAGVYEFYLDRGLLYKEPMSDFSLDIKIYNNNKLLLAKDSLKDFSLEDNGKYIKIGELELKAGSLKVLTKANLGKDNSLRLVLVAKPLKENIVSIINKRLSSLGAKIVYISASNDKGKVFIP